MLIDQVFFYFLIGIGVILSMPALWLLMRARWPRRVEKLRKVAELSMILSFILGLIPFLLVVGLLGAVTKLGQKGDIVPLIMIALFAAIIVVWAMAGLAGLVGLIGEKLTSSTGATGPWKSTLRGGIVIVCLLSMPYVGWFALLPVCLITGGGMMLRSFFVKTEVPALSLVPQTAPPLPLPQTVPTA